MGWLKNLHDNTKKSMELTEKMMTTTPIAVAGLPLMHAMDKAVVKAIEKETEDYVYEGKKQGYAEASDEYEKKLLEQADSFLQQKKDFMKERDEYEALLDDYDKVIQKSQRKNEKSQQEIALLNELLLKERELRKISE